MSAIGTKRTFQCQRSMSAFGVKRTWRVCEMSTNDPKWIMTAHTIAAILHASTLEIVKMR